MKHPDAAQRDRASWIALGRHPETPGAQAFSQAVTEAVCPAMDRKRPISGKGLVTLQQDVGLMLAGLMRPGLQGQPVRAHSSSAGTMWDNAPIGHARFWRIADALGRAGMVGKVASDMTRYRSGGRPGVTAACLWPSDALEALAARHGVTEATRRIDWRADPTTLAVASPLSREALATCPPLDGCPPPPVEGMRARLDALRSEVATINAANAQARITGAGRSVSLARRFQHSPDFGGRFYAPYTNMSEDDRLRITINGSSVVEIDVKASQLTMLLGFTGHSQAPPDAYALPGIPREVAKAWVVQTLGGGRPARRWSKGATADARSVPCSRVKAAVCALYPFLADLPALLPAAVLDSLPADERQWGAGQWLVQREASIITRAMLELSAAAIPVLPVHDSLIVPATAADAARDALTAAYRGLAGIEPRLTTSAP